MSRTASRKGWQCIYLYRWCCQSSPNAIWHPCQQSAKVSGMIRLTDKEDHDGFVVDLDGEQTVKISYDQACRLKDALVKRLNPTTDRTRAARQKWGQIARNGFDAAYDTGRYAGWVKDPDGEIVLTWFVAKTPMLYTPEQFEQAQKPADRVRVRQWLAQNMPKA